MNITTGEFTHYNKHTIPALPSEQTWTIMEEGNNTLYIGHVDNGLSILSLKDKSVKHFIHNPQDPHSLPGNDVRCIYKDTNENIWIGTNKGLALFNPNTNSFTNFHMNPGNSQGALSSYIFSIKQFKDNKLSGKVMTITVYQTPAFDMSFKIHSIIYGLVPGEEELILSAAVPLHSIHGTTHPSKLTKEL